MTDESVDLNGGLGETENTEGNDNAENVDAEVETKPEPKLSRKLKIKVDSQEFDEDLPFDFDETNKEQVEFLKRHLQMSKAASKRMNEAATTRKQAEQFIQALRDDPMRILQDDRIMGSAKFRAIAEEFLTKQIQEEMLSPEERKRIQMEDRLKQYEEMERQNTESVETEKMRKLEEYHAENYQKIIIDALQTSDLPKNPFTVKRMAALMHKNLEHGLDLEPKYLAELVREDYQKELVSLVGGADASQILKMFGDDLANKIRKHDLEKLKAQQPGFGQARSTQFASQQSGSRDNSRMRPDEYEAHLRDKIK